MAVIKTGISTVNLKLEFVEISAEVTLFATIITIFFFRALGIILEWRLQIEKAFFGDSIFEIAKAEFRYRIDS